MPVNFNLDALSDKQTEQLSEHLIGELSMLAMGKFKLADPPINAALASQSTMSLNHMIF
jgi:hypothetical protein